MTSTQVIPLTQINVVTLHHLVIVTQDTETALKHFVGNEITKVGKTKSVTVLTRTKTKRKWVIITERQGLLRHKRGGWHSERQG